MELPGNKTTGIVVPESLIRETQRWILSERSKLPPIKKKSTCEVMAKEISELKDDSLLILSGSTKRATDFLPVRKLCFNFWEMKLFLIRKTFPSFEFFS